MSRAQPLLRSLSARGLRFGIVVARYNTQFTDAMLAAAIDTFAKAGARPEQIRIIRVPGSFEVPVVVSQLAAGGKFDALLALGVILRGETTHADLIAAAITHRLSEIAVREGVPVIHEVLLLNKTRQAQARCLGKKHNRGAEAARSAIEMAQVMRQLNR